MTKARAGQLNPRRRRSCWVVFIALSFTLYACGDGPSTEHDEERPDIVEGGDSSPPPDAPDAGQPDAANPTPDPSGSISGAVTVDGQGVDGHPVIITRGDFLELVETSPDGDFELRDMPHGTYMVSAELESTKEGRREVAVKVSGATPMPALAFSGVGAVRGTVQDLEGAPIRAATIDLLGGTTSATSDEDGEFSIEDVPTGSWTLAARAQVEGRAEPVERSTAVQVSYNQIQEVALSLDTSAPPLPPEPTLISGSVAFHALSDPSEITVSIPALDIQTPADENGRYEFEVPPGTWELWAEAPYYSPQMIEEVTVEAEESRFVGQYTLSLYDQLPDTAEPEGSWSLVERDELPPNSPPHAALLKYSSPANDAYYLFNYPSEDIQLIAVATAPPLLSDDSKYAVLQDGSDLIIIDIENTTSFEVETDDVLNHLEFDHHSELLIARPRIEGDPYDGYPDVLPLPSSAYIINLSSEELVQLTTYDSVESTPTLVRTSPDDEPAVWVALEDDMPELFQNVSRIYFHHTSQGVTFYGREDCPDPSCSLYIWTPNQDAPTELAGHQFEENIFADYDSGDWFSIRDEQGITVLVNHREGLVDPLPSNLQLFTISPRGERAILHDPTEDIYYDAALPVDDFGALTPLPLPAVSPLYTEWISPTRFFTRDANNDLLEFDRGQLIKRHQDVELDSYHYIRESYLAWADSAGNFYVALADKPVFEMPIPGSVTQSPAGLVTAAAPMSQGDAQAPSRFIIRWSDGSASFIKDSQLLRTDYSLQAFPPTELIEDDFELIMLQDQPNLPPYLIEFDTGKVIQLVEPGIIDMQMLSVPYLGYTLFLTTKDANAPVENRYNYTAISGVFEYIIPQNPG